MMTGDRLLKIVTGTLVAAFVIFAIVVVSRELMRRSDPLARIAEETCDTVTAAGADAPPGASFLPSPPSSAEEAARIPGCLFIDAAVRDATPLSKSFFAHETVPGWDYLYLGPRGVLVIRDERSFKAEADAIRSCIRQNACSDADAAPEKDPVSLTISLLTPSGERPVTVSFYERRLRDILREAPALLAEMCAAKGRKMSDLAIETTFHRRYALVGAPDEKTISGLARPGRDGLLLASRGAKIRLLPWEYRANPLRALAAKGVPYGLEKEEYRKEVATVRIFLTERFREEAGSMSLVSDGIAGGAPDER